MATNQSGLQEKRLAVLQEISEATVVTDNITTLANLMLDLAVCQTMAEKGSLMLVNDTDELAIFAARGIDLKFIQSYRLKIGEGIAGTVAASMTPVLVSDIALDERFRGKCRDRYRTRSFISCPIVCRNRLLGVLNINDRLDGADFSESDFDLVKTVANQAAIALENAMLMNRLRRKAVELEETNRKLIEMDVVKTEFLTRVSHELRTPLNAVKGAVYYLRHGQHDRRRDTEFLSIIAEETETLVASVESQLQFLKMEDETKLASDTVFDLREIVEESVASRSCSTSAAARGIELAVSCCDTIVETVGDRVRTLQLFLNIIEGMLTMGDGGDRLSITIGSSETHTVTWSLSRPLPQEILASLFQSNIMFLDEGDQAKIKLYLAAKIAALHQWGLDAQNIGNRFVVTLSVPHADDHRKEAAVTATLDMFLEFVSGVLAVDICSVMLCDDSGDLTIRTARGLDEATVARVRISPGERIAGHVAVEGKPVFVENIETDPRFGRKSTSQYNSRSLISLPLKVGKQTVGVLNLNNKKSGLPLSRHDFLVAEALAERMSVVLEKLQSTDSGGMTHEQLKGALDLLVEAQKRYGKKKGTASELMLRVMEEMGFDEELMQTGLYVSLLYDLGLSLLDEEMMTRPELRPKEMKSVRIHPYGTIGLLDCFEFSPRVREAILHHHERLDGSGYPSGLKGEEIPLLSRVLAVVDTYCALISDRPYRAKYAREKALAELQGKAGEWYDPAVVEAVGKAVKN